MTSQYTLDTYPASTRIYEVWRREDCPGDPILALSLDAATARVYARQHSQAEAIPRVSRLGDIPRSDYGLLI